MITALWLAVVLLVQTPGQISNSTFKVNGMIIREDGREPDRVSDADRVLLRGNGVSKVFDIDTGGAFEFTNVRPGSYEIVVGPRVSMEPVKVVVTDKDVSGVRVVVPDRVILSGTVMMDASGPSPRFQLSFTRMDGPAPSGPVSVTAATTFTAALSPGQYRVTTDGLPNSFTLKSVTLDTTDVLAQPMKLTSGDSPSLSVMLGVAAPAPWVKVTGRIVGGNAGPVPPGSVSMVGPAILETLTAPVQSDGSFEFPKVLPGIYDVRTLPVTVLSAGSTLTVGPTDVTNFQLRTPQPREIKGRILIQGDVPMPRLAFSVGGATVPANPQPGGSFTIALPEGERQISIVPTSVPAGYTLTSFTYGTTDLLKNPLRVAAGDNAQLNVAFNATSVMPVNVRGRVTGLLTKKGVRVVLWSPLLASVEASVNPDGSFSFSKILPGNYAARLSLSGLSVATAITVGTQDVKDVVINYPREFVVTGHVIVEGGGHRRSTASSAGSETGSGRPVTANVSGNGVIMLNVKDGEYNIAIRDVPSAYQVKSIMYGTTDLQKQPLKIDGPVTWEIIVRLAAGR